MIAKATGWSLPPNLMKGKMMPESLKQKRVLVVGMARSGVAAAELLARLGARSVLSDVKDSVDDLPRLMALGCINRLAEPPESLVRGCDMVVLSPAIPPDAPVIAEAKRLGIPVLAELAFAARYVQGTLLAITGTNGKTTTSALLGDILTNAGKVTFVAGNIGLPLSAVALKSKPTDFFVTEVSSFQLENMDDFHPHGSAILNLTPDHLNRHGTMEAYGSLKEGMLRNQGADDFFVYNADDAFCAAAALRCGARRIPFSRTQTLHCGAWCADEQIHIPGCALCSAGELSAALPGPHNLENALAATAIAVELQILAPVIRHSLRTFQGIPHRMEYVRTVEGVRYINDSKGTNPESSTQAVRAMKQPTILIAGGQSKHTDLSGFVRAICESGYICHAVLIGDTAEMLGDALALSGYNAYTLAGYDFEKAVGSARRLARDGGAVLLSPACASFDMFKDFEERGARFREIVQALR
ncbi:MAG: UDP-N-acetylmuramoyl-L-alanine--D-glutamate ligase [Clostridia bacterium]|nr:UDP-N-acetylmuramoyl-L-alanine--D-glutamate ligase [Clostridia bacterium]